MRKQTALGIAMLVLTLVVANGCSSGSQTDSTDLASPRAGGAEQSLSSADQAKAAAKDGKGGVATPRESLVPLLQRAHNTHIWPAKYDTTGDKIYDRIASNAANTVYAEKDANNLVAFYNTCAWTMQLIQETKTQADTRTSTAALMKLSAASTPDQSLDGFIQPILSGARLSDLTSANNFVRANDCAAALGS